MRIKKVIVLDTSAFIAGFEPLSIQDLQYSVPEVKNELIVNSLPWTRFNAAVENRRLKVKNPKSDYIEKVKKSSKVVGDLLHLSKADIHVLALALELKALGKNPQIITDDYSMQNVAHQMGIKFASLMTLGIRYHFNWMFYCPACHYKYPADFHSKLCDICGTTLKRKPIGKTPVRK
ncbi:MAG: hypothetical protein JSV51_04535 [Candidatus Bathyarchaeota archaeon]|nr:MAG: hypothetical protein JSV51_04535 [Candidatus Bathyarchaeota archaeon]